jgi:hypothetical protein
MYVLTKPDIRLAEVIERETLFHTNDGDVIGRPGERDIAITQGDETYPIPSRIFFGTYEVIGKTGTRMIARRLIHVRIAREVVSASVEYDYGTAAGVVAVDRGGWLYQSDDDDEGLINKKKKHVGHFEVGPVEQVERVSWSRRFEQMNMFLTFLPPILTALALVSFSLAGGSDTDTGSWKDAASGLETTLLFLGLGVGLWMRARRWALKAAVRAGVQVATRYQLVAQILGEPGSRQFPQMALWRAGQAAAGKDPGALYSEQNAKRFETLREYLAETQEDIGTAIRRDLRIERMGEVAEVLSILLAVGGNLWLMVVPEARPVELVSLWLPSLIGALHAVRSHRRTAERLPLLHMLFKQLEFVRAQLLTFAEWRADEPAQRSAAREAVLRFVCKVIGQYCQSELQLATSQRPEMPA